MKQTEKILEERRNIRLRQKRLELAPGPQRLAFKLRILAGDSESVKNLSDLIQYSSPDQLAEDLRALFDYIIFLESNFLGHHDEDDGAK